MKKVFSLTALLALCGLGVGVLASCQDIPAVYLGGETEPAHTHSYSSEVTTAATCTEEGVMTYTCECGDSYTEVIPALGHDFSSPEYVVLGEEGVDSGWHYVCSRCGKVGEALGEDIDPLAGGEVVASTANGLEAALEAVNEVDSGRESEVVITLTGDVEIEEGGLEISGSNVTLTGEGELSISDSIVVSGSDVTLDGLTIDASSISYEDEDTVAAGAIKVTGASTTITGCTITGGAGSEENSKKASILITVSTEDSEVTISDCEISGGYRGIYVNGGKSVNLAVSDCEVHAAYAFNYTGTNTGMVLTFTDSKLYGWTSFAAVKEASFTDCIFGFSECEGTTRVTGGFKPYSDVTLTGCYFSSLNTSGITLEGDQKNDTEDYLVIKSNNFGIAVGADNVKITLLGCSYEQSLEEGGVSTAIVSEENVINLMYSTNFTTYSSSGFVFSADAQATLWTLSALTDAGYGVPAE